jgi:hypothetical protein
MRLALVGATGAASYDRRARDGPRHAVVVWRVEPQVFGVLYRGDRLICVGSVSNPADHLMARLIEKGLRCRRARNPAGRRSQGSRLTATDGNHFARI